MDQLSVLHATVDSYCLSLSKAQFYPPLGLSVMWVILICPSAKSHVLHPVKVQLTSVAPTLLEHLKQGVP